MKTTTLTITVLLLALARLAQANFVQTFNTGFQNGGVIPDGSRSGWTDTQTLSGAPVDPITGLSVTLNLSGGWNGDLYAYLVHSSGFAVLLNRVGRTGANDSGYGDAGMSVTFNDAAPVNIHSVTPPVAGGRYQPDGRNISPLASGAAFDAATPTALLSSFNGLNANGSWTLFIADVSNGDQSTITSWGVNIDTAAVPEPGSIVEGGVAVLFLGGVIGLYRLKGPKTIR